MITITNKENCCGCNACLQSCPTECIEMEEDKEGFLYPNVNISLCIDCNRCEKVCPVINQGQSRLPLMVYAAKNKNNKIRLQSTSGGAFSSIAEYVLSNEGIVFGAKYDKDWNVVHDYITDISDLSLFYGSKYVESKIGRSYETVQLFLKSGKLVLFTGTPCQIAGLNTFLRKPFENLITVDIICHGVPSSKIWSKYLKARQNGNLQNIVCISFRNKDFGWSSSSFKILTNDNSDSCIKEPSGTSLFLKGFYRHLYLRPSCHSCPSKSLKSQSDITIGDFWGISSFHSEFNDEKGVSLVLVNSKKGEQIFNILNLDIISSEYKIALAKNPSIEQSCLPNKNRDKFFNELNSLDIITLLNKYTKPSFKERGRSFLRKITSCLLEK
ncbi:Coenzyme F420 hydrogenase/dehydrogenase, beta subunit C-terminal domain [Dysgonomonas sp. Marseille-P4361]|uniref:Coenzyme F420 hydrogenase/dehydrogenase, beta subunit C-terminal domain n=1 Tax=Dysgonomonas sp. Marseille-P4361 TaxID=2161820 RepID=UPI000D5531C3|nr:Coenzyme F420 hydrogenase/dehydrogenase, beta subunit C-terminal domain [Dysgonomonas sp. Marseille-P4361]